MPAWKVGDELEVRASERVDRLGIVAHAGQAAAAGRHRVADRTLQRVDVLVLVDQDVVVRPRELVGDVAMLRVPQQGVPVHEQVVEVADVHVALALREPARHVLDGRQLGAKLRRPRGDEFC